MAVAQFAHSMCEGEDAYQINYNTAVITGEDRDVGIGEIFGFEHKDIIFDGDEELFRLTTEDGAIHYIPITNTVLMHDRLTNPEEFLCSIIGEDGRGWNHINRYEREQVDCQQLIKK